MQYETPEITALPAMAAIEHCSPIFKNCGGPGPLDSQHCNDVVVGYIDWEWD